MKAYLKRKETLANLAALRLASGIDAALFGRMVTSDILARGDGAIHVAHALTVHEEESEPDYFVAIDDLTREAGELGTGLIQTSELTSGLFYVYAVVDVPQLVSNLEGCKAPQWRDADLRLAGRVIERLVHVIATTSPGAKLGSTAPYGYADLVLAEAGRRQPRSLLANALGYRHEDADALGALQRRLRLGAALIRPGTMLRDYHTVDLGHEHLKGRGWTTRGFVEERAGASGETTHIRFRWYMADACVVAALCLDPAEAAPTLEQLAEALDHPVRPLFIGRKTCLPTARLSLGIVEAQDVTAALRHAIATLGKEALLEEASVECELDRRLASTAAADADADLERIVDGRDWRNQMHLIERAVLRPAGGLTKMGAP